SFLVTERGCSVALISPIAWSLDDEPLRPLNLDATRSSALRPRQDEPQYTVAQFRGDAVAIHVVAEDERAREGDGGEFQMEGLGRFGDLRIDRGADGQDVVGDLDHKRLFGDAG